MYTLGRLRGWNTESDKGQDISGRSYEKITTLSARKIFLSHSFCYQHGSVSISTIISVNYKNSRNLKILSKYESEPFDVTKHVSNFLHSY